MTVTIFRVGLIVDGDDMLGMHPSPALAEAAADHMRQNGYPHARAIAMVPVEVFEPVRRAVIAYNALDNNPNAIGMRVLEEADEAVLDAVSDLDRALWASANPAP